MITSVLFSHALRAWPFMVADTVMCGEAETASERLAAAAGASARSIPHGNHGDNLRSVQK
jgi:hypothetical protein